MPHEVAIILGIILAAIGAFHSVFMLYDWYCDNKLVKMGKEITAKVTEAATCPDIENVNTGEYRYYAEFVVNSVTYYTSSRFTGSSTDEYLGKEVIVIYDPANPEKARFKNDVSVVFHDGEYVFLFLVGVGLLLYGLFF